MAPADGEGPALTDGGAEGRARVTLVRHRGGNSASATPSRASMAWRNWPPAALSSER